MPTAYQIRVNGHLDISYSVWLGEFVITHTPDGDTLLTGDVVDQAALYGVLKRCRDLGLTLISVNPISVEIEPVQTGGWKMSKTVQVAVDQIINARAEQLYAIVRDYHVGHPAIVPKAYFTALTVEKGGVGEGTVVISEGKVMGTKFRYRHVVTEPQPGHLLVETDSYTGQWSSFTFDPVNGGAQTRVTITAEYPLSAGFKGFMEKLINPLVSRRMFKEELDNLEAYARSAQAAPQPS